VLREAQLESKGARQKRGGGKAVGPEWTDRQIIIAFRILGDR